MKTSILSKGIAAAVLAVAVGAAHAAGGGGSAAGGPDSKYQTNSMAVEMAREHYVKTKDPSAYPTAKAASDTSDVK